MLSEKEHYAFLNLPGHLYRAGEEERLRHLLSFYSFLASKVRNRFVPDLISDYDFLSEESPLRLVQAAIRMSAHILESDPDQLAGQLHGRLLHLRDKAEIAALLDAARQRPSRGLVPTTASLTHVGGALLQTFPGYRSAIQAIALTRDGEGVVSGSADRTVCIWSLASGRELRTLRGHGSRVTAVGLTPDGRSVISGSEDRTLRIWNLNSGTQEVEIPTESGVTVLAVAPDGGRVMAGLADGSIQAVDLATGAVRRLSGHKKRIRALAFTPDGRCLLSTSEDGTLWIRNLADGSAEKFDGPAGSLWSVVVAIEGDRIFCGSQDNTIGVWSLAERRKVATWVGHRRPVTALALSRDGRTLASLAEDGTLRIWDPVEGRLLRVIAVRNTGPLALTADGSRALVGLTVWDLSVPGEPPVVSEYPLGIRALTMAPGGRLVISASTDRTLKIWDILTGRMVRTLTGHTSGVVAVSLAADDTRVVSGGIHIDIKVWSLENGQEIYSRRRPSGYLTMLAATPDGRLAVVGFQDEGDEWPAILNIETGHVVGQLRGHEAAVESVLVIEEGRRILTGSYDATVRLWDFASRRELRLLEGHKERVLSLAVTPDGRYAVSSSDDATLRVWRLDTGECLATFNGEGSISACAISPDARLLVAGEPSGQLHFFRMRA